VIKPKITTITVWVWKSPEDSRRLRLPDFQTVGTQEGGMVVSPTYRPPLTPSPSPGNTADEISLLVTLDASDEH